VKGAWDGLCEYISELCIERGLDGAESTGQLYQVGCNGVGARYSVEGHDGDFQSHMDASPYGKLGGNTRL